MGKMTAGKRRSLASDILKFKRYKTSSERCFSITQITELEEGPVLVLKHIKKVRK